MERKILQYCKEWLVDQENKACVMMLKPTVIRVNPKSLLTYDSREFNKKTSIFLLNWKYEKAVLNRSIITIMSPN